MVAQRVADGFTRPPVGLDPAFGFSDADELGRDSFVLDVLEGLRPTVEGLVLELADERPFRKRDFTEAVTGELRVAPPFSHEFVELLTPRLTAAAGPVVERVARMLADEVLGPMRVPTPLTRTARKRAGKATWASREPRAPVSSPMRTSRRRAERRCEGCGVPVDRQRSWCAACWPERRAEAGRSGSAKARERLVNPAARAQKGEAIADARRAGRDARVRAVGYEPSDWERSILPALHASGITPTDIRLATGLSSISCYRLLSGAQVPGVEHWALLAHMAGAALPRPRRPVD
jgi:hypothetical protein